MTTQQGILFDFNGTLFFDTAFHETAWRQYAWKLCGREVSDEEFRAYVHGRTNREILAHFVGEEALTPEAVERILGDLPLAVREDGDGEQFRISGAAALLPSVLALLRGPLPEDIENS